MTVSHRSLFGLIALVLGISAGMQWWHGVRESRLGTEVARQAQPGDIRLLVSDTCPACHVARHWLQTHRVPYSECSIERDAECARAFEQAQAFGTPLVMVKGQPQLGFDPRRVLERLGSASTSGMRRG